MALHAGHCAVCDGLVFVSLFVPTTGDRVLLWPDPTAVFARVAVAEPDIEIPGVAYCGAHAPQVGDPAPERMVAQLPGVGTIAAIETAHQRHVLDFSDDYGRWLMAWLPTACKVDPAPWMAQWITARLTAPVPDEETAGGRPADPAHA